MISKEDIQTLVSVPARSGSQTLSVYLDVDQSKGSKINRKFEQELKVLLQSRERELELARKKDFLCDISQISKFMLNYQPSGRTLVMFSDDSEDFFWARGMKISVPSQVHYMETPYVLPLLEAHDEYERYGVVLADKNKARIFTVLLGEIEEEEGMLASNDVKFIKTTGKDNLRSQMQLQRTDELHAQWHFKRVAQTIEESSRNRSFNRLILAGAHEHTHEIYDHLSKSLQSRVAATVVMPVRSRKDEILKKVLSLETEIESKKEKTLVEQIVTARRKHGNIALGMSEVLAAMPGNRIWKLIYCQGYSPAGYYCENCPVQFSAVEDACSSCGTRLKRTGNLLERLAECLFRMGGEIEKVSHKASETLREIGDIAAILRS